VLAGKPIFAGTRIPVAAVQRYLAAGYETDAIVEEYPSLTRPTSEPHDAMRPPEQMS